MPLPKVIVLTVPRDTDETGPESVKALLLRAVPEYSEPDADELIKMADSARLIDPEARREKPDHDPCPHELCEPCAYRRGYNACLDDSAKGV